MPSAAGSGSGLDRGRHAQELAADEGVAGGDDHPLEARRPGHPLQLLGTVERVAPSPGRQRAVSMVTAAARRTRARAGRRRGSGSRAGGRLGQHAVDGDLIARGKRLRARPGRRTGAAARRRRTSRRTPCRRRSSAERTGRRGPRRSRAPACSLVHSVSYTSRASSASTMPFTPRNLLASPSSGTTAHRMPFVRPWLDSESMPPGMPSGGGTGSSFGSGTTRRLTKR